MSSELVMVGPYTPMIISCFLLESGSFMVISVSLMPRGKLLSLLSRSFSLQTQCHIRVVFCVFSTPEECVACSNLLLMSSSASRTCLTERSDVHFVSCLLSGLSAWALTTRVHTFYAPKIMPLPSFSSL